MRKSSNCGFLILTLALALTGCGDKNETAADAGPDTTPDTTVDIGPDAEVPMDEGCEPADFPEMTLEPVAPDYEFNGPLHLTQAPGDDETIFIVQRHGKVLVLQDGEVRDEPFIDLSETIITGFPSRGLLGLAFHPDYQENGRFFVSYTSSGTKRNVVAEYHRSDDKTYRANPEEVRRLVKIKDPKKQHNGGTIAFGPDGYLYASLGNGGAKEKRKHDGIGQAQYLGNVFGTIMRMDVDNPEGNFAAPDNPFIDREDADDRIFLYGLRNPWRFTFDAETGDMFISDVGKKSREEINYVAAESDGGQNFGWPAWEGTKEGPVETAKKAVDEHTEPIHEYHYGSTEDVVRESAATVGGTVYRGEQIPALQGYFIHGDLNSEDVGALMYCDTDDADAEPEIVDHKRLEGITAPNLIRGIVPDNAGNLYLVGKSEIKRLTLAESG